MPNMLPFRQGTRQRIKPIGRVTYTLGQRPSVEIPRVGFLAGIFAVFDGTVTLSSGGALAALNGAEGILQRIGVQINLGTASIVDISGPMCRAFHNDFYRSDSALDTMRSTPVASGANRWVVPFYIPIALNDGREFQNGLINLQAPEVRATVDLTFAAAGSEFVTNFSSVTGVIELYTLYYEVPRPNEVMFPPLVMHRIIQERQTITTTGDQVYTVPRQGTLLSLGHLLTLNSVLTPASTNTSNNAPVQSMRLIAQKNDEIYQLSQNAFLLNFANRHGRGVSPMMFGYDFLDGEHASVGEGDNRNVIDSESVATLESIITIASGTTIGVAYLDTVRRFVQVLSL